MVEKQTMIYLIGVSRIQKQQQKTQGLEGWIKCHQAEDLGRSPFTSACGCSNPADPFAQAAHEQDRLALLPRELPAGAAYLQAGGQSGCKSKGLFSLWGQDSMCMIREPSVDGTGRPPPSCSRSVPEVSDLTWLPPCPRFCPKHFQTHLSASWGWSWLFLGALILITKCVARLSSPPPAHTTRGNLFCLFSLRHSTLLRICSASWGES